MFEITLPPPRKSSCLSAEMLFVGDVVVVGEKMALFVEMLAVVEKVVRRCCLK